MGDPGVSDRGWGTHRGPDLQQIGGDQLSWGKCEPVLKSCQALGPEVRNSKEKEETEGGGTLRTSWKPRDQGVQKRELYSTAGV